MASREGDIVSVHPSTVAVAIDKATIVLEFLEYAAKDRGDELGRAAWSVARDAMAHAADAFAEARKVQSNRRNATGGVLLRAIITTERKQPVHFARRNPKTRRIGPSSPDFIAHPLHDPSRLGPYASNTSPFAGLFVACTEQWDGTGSRTLLEELVTCPACAALVNP